VRAARVAKQLIASPGANHNVRTTFGNLTRTMVFFLILAWGINPADEVTFV
jgi:hypothetical protein